MKTATRPSHTRKAAKPAEYVFVFRGFRDGWYLLTVDVTIPSQHLDTLAFENRVTEWLLDEAGEHHFGAGNTGEYPVLPSDEWDGHLALLLKQPADVMRLVRTFRCQGLTDQTLLAAIRAESEVHRFTTEDIAKIAHQTIQSMLLTFGTESPDWTEIGGETRIAFTLMVKHRIAYPGETSEQIHAHWMTQRVHDKWKYGSRLDQTALTDPLLVPWKNLNNVSRTRFALVASVVDSLKPLVEAK